MKTCEKALRLHSAKFNASRQRSCVCVRGIREVGGRRKKKGSLRVRQGVVQKVAPRSCGLC